MPFDIDTSQPAAVAAAVNRLEGRQPSAQEPPPDNTNFQSMFARVSQKLSASFVDTAQDVATAGEEQHARGGSMRVSFEVDTSQVAAVADERSFSTARTDRQVPHYGKGTSMATQCAVAPISFVAGHPDRQAPPGSKVCAIFLLILGAAVAFAIFIVAIAPGKSTCECTATQNWPCHAPVLEVESQEEPAADATPNLSPAGYALAAVLGQSRQNVLQASALTLIACVSLILCTVTSAWVVTFRPGHVQLDFEMKGTLSNVSQDVTQPRGRMFAVMLFLASLLAMVSSYTAHIYLSWVQWTDQVTFMSPLFQSRSEKNFRILWLTIPYVGLMYTALLPSLSDNRGTNVILTLVHNVAAPLGLAFALLMETVQLSWGENAFSYFFCGDEWAHFAGPLEPYQRVRVVLCCYTWAALFVFLSVQVYFGLGDVLGMRITTTYSLALVSFYAEIMCMIFVFSLPAVQGLAIVMQMYDTSVMHDAYALSLGIGTLNAQGLPNNRAGGLNGFHDATAQLLSNVMAI